MHEATTAGTSERRQIAHEIRELRVEVDDIRRHVSIILADGAGREHRTAWLMAHDRLGAASAELTDALAQIPV